MNFFRNDCKADLHIHSTFSDGALTPEEIVTMAVQAGISIISITDHDSIGGIAPAKKAAQRSAITVINGVEFSAMIEEIEIHILGYGFDTEHPALQKHLEYFRYERYRRAERILDKLSSAGLPISIEQVTASARHSAIGRPHIAEVMVQKGYTATTAEAFRDYIGRDGIAFESKTDIAPSKIIDIIKSAGGVAVLAHPSRCIKEKYIIEMIRDGLDGIETVHPYVPADSVGYYRRLIKQYHLIETGGSDFHGRAGQQEFGRHAISETLVDALKARVVFNKLMH